MINIVPRKIKIVSIKRFIGKTRNEVVAYKMGVPWPKEIDAESL